MKRNSLTVAFYQLSCQSSTRKEDIEKPSCRPLDQLLSPVVQAFKAKKITPTLRRAGKLVEIEDVIQHSAHEFQFLISVADADKPDPVIKHMTTRQRRNAGKGRDEGLDVSTHVLVQCMPGGYSAKLRMTRGGHVSATLVCELLGRAIRALKRDKAHSSLFNFPHPSGATGAVYAVQYAFECDSEANQTVQDALSHGELKEVELISSCKSDVVDAETGLELKSQSLTLSPSASGLKGGLRALKKLISSKDMGIDADHVRLRFRPNENAKDIERTFKVDGLEGAFTLSKEIMLQSDVQSVYTKINKEIIDAMRALK